MASTVTKVAEEFDTIDVRPDDPVKSAVTVVFDRPEARNAMNEALRSGFKTVLSEIESSEYQVVVLTGSEGSGAFVSGADVSEIRGRDTVDQRAVRDRRTPLVYECVDDLSKPIIAKVNGHAFGGGLELALACDIRIASSDVKLGFPEVTLGLIPGGGGTQRLPSLVGEGQALRLILTGEPVSASEADDLGFVDSVVDPDALDETVAGMVDAIASNGPVAVELAKQAVKASAEMDLSAGLEYEAELFAQVCGTDDKDEGISAFLEGRGPEWSGR